MGESLIVKPGRHVVAPFYASLAASANATYVSKRLTAPFVIEKIRAKFAPGVENLLLLRFFVSPDNSAPTAQPLTGVNIFSQLGQVDYITGDDDVIEIEPQLEVDTRGAYLKVYAENSDTFIHSVNAQITIKMVDV